MQFQPKTEKQLVEESLIPAGIYPFEVAKAEAKTSKQGNEMIELSLRVFMPNGTERALKDWLMPKLAFKLFHFCAYTGLSQEYEAGTLTAADCEGRSGFAKIDIQADKLGQYPDRNTVRDYVRSADGKMPKSGGIATQAPTAASAVSGPPTASDGADSDGPF